MRKMTTFNDQSILFCALAMKISRLSIPSVQQQMHLDAVHDITMSELFKWCRVILCRMIVMVKATTGNDWMRCSRNSRHTSTLKSTSWTRKYAKNAIKYWALKKPTNVHSVIIRVINIALLIRWVNYIHNALYCKVGFWGVSI